MGIRIPEPLTNDQLRRFAPAIFAAAPADHLTTRYHMVPTIALVEAMRKEGFLPFSARQSTSRSDGGALTGRHEVRFRHVDTIAQMRALAERKYTFDTKWVHQEDHVFDEIGLLGAHDGTALLELFRGAERVICLNGLMLSTGAKDRVAIRHDASIIHNVIEGATRIIEEIPLMIEAREDMRGIQLGREDQLQFAEAALQLRYEGQAPILPEDLLRPRRAEDELPTLWNTFNVVQENMVRGGVRGHTVNTGRRMTTRGITSIVTDHAVNRMLWNLAQAARNMTDTLDLGDNTVKAEVADPEEVLAD